MQPLLTQLLNFQGMTVEDYRDLGDELVLEVEKSQDCAICPRCHQTSDQVHQNHFRLVRDLSWSNRPVWLRLNRRQFKCQHCEKPFSESFEGIGERRRYTDRFAELIVQQVIHSDTHNVAKNHGLTDDLVWSMVEYISKKKGPLT